jgi:hypothetical protein
MTDKVTYSDCEFEIERTPFKSEKTGELIQWTLRRSLNGVVVAKGEARDQAQAEDQIQIAIEIEYYRTKDSRP